MKDPEEYYTEYVRNKILTKDKNNEQHDVKYFDEKDYILKLISKVQTDTYLDVIEDLMNPKSKLWKIIGKVNDDFICKEVERKKRKSKNENI